MSDQIETKVAPQFTITPELVKDIFAMAIKHRKQVKIGYIDTRGNIENRIIEPFEFDKTGRNVGGWCLLRDGYRNFSFDRVVRIVMTDYNQTKEPTEKVVTP
jgi:predicted DNA-binding transcriptional regulator YafY